MATKKPRFSKTVTIPQGPGVECYENVTWLQLLTSRRSRWSSAGGEGSAGENVLQTPRIPAIDSRAFLRTAAISDLRIGLLK
jgi:hypothetical protein